MFGDDGNGGRSPRMASRALAWVCWLPIVIEDKGILFQITGLEVEEMSRWLHMWAWNVGEESG